MRKLLNVRATIIAAVIVVCWMLVIGSGQGSHNSDISHAAAANVHWTLASGVRLSGAALTKLNAMETVFAESEQTYEAMFAPPPATTMASTSLEDQPTVTPPATLDSTGRHAYLSPVARSTIEVRAHAALDRVFTSAMAAKESRIVTGVVNTASAGQDLLGGGGASVANYSTESMTANSATLTADVNQWSRIGYVNPTTGKVYWQINRALVVVKDRLTYAAGQWRVAERTWDYAPGQGP